MATTKCLKCNRKLTAEISKKRGYGPTCYAKIQKENTNKAVSINWSVIGSLINTIRDKISNKTLEILTVLKHNPLLIKVIDETNDVIDRIIRPIVNIMNPAKNKEIVLF